MMASRRSIRKLAERLTDRDRSVLGSLVAHRMLSARQLQRLHFFDAPSEASAARLTRQRMAYLAELGLVARLERRVGGVRAGSSGSIWRATDTGHQAVGTADRRKRRDYEPGSAYVAHTVACAEVFVQVVETDRSSELELLTYSPEPHCWRAYAGSLGEALTLKPDGFVAVARGEFEEHAFIEVDRGTHGSTALRRKLAIYRDYQRSGSEQSRGGVFPRVIWLTLNHKRMQLLQSLIAELPADVASSHDVALLDDFIVLLLRQRSPETEGAS